MNYNAVFMLTGLSLNKKIKLFNSKTWNLLCFTDSTGYPLYGHESLTSPLLLQERPLVYKWKL